MAVTVVVSAGTGCVVDALGAACVADSPGEGCVADSTGSTIVGVDSCADEALGLGAALVGAVVVADGVGVADGCALWGWLLPGSRAWPSPRANTREISARMIFSTWVSTRKVPKVMGTFLTSGSYE